MIHASVELILAMRGVGPNISHPNVISSDYRRACDGEPGLAFHTKVYATYGQYFSDTDEDTRTVDCPKCLVLMDTILSGELLPSSFVKPLRLNYTLYGVNGIEYPP